MERLSWALPSFQNDACIIEEQDDHLVLAVRVPKALIASNLHLLAALAERSGMLTHGLIPVGSYAATYHPRKMPLVFKYLLMIVVTTAATFFSPASRPDHWGPNQGHAASATASIQSWRAPMYLDDDEPRAEDPIPLQGI
jgi:hypothetical protein